MMATTHLTFGLVTTLASGSVVGVPLHRDWPALLGAALASLLPDLDNPRSALGRLCRPLAVRLERLADHRTVTHSLLAAAALAIALAPLAWLRPTLYAAALLGFLSHLFLDCATLSGVVLFYPLPTVCVLPRNERFRLAVNSPAEYVLSFLFVALATALVPVSQLGGVYQSARYLLATQSAAYQAYQDAATQTVLTFRGRWRDSRLPVSGQAFVLEGSREHLLIAFQGEVLRYADQGDIVPERSWVQAIDRPVQTQPLQVRRRSWDDLLTRIPADAWVSGHLSATAAFVDRGAGEGRRHTDRQHRSLVAGDSTLDLSFASRPRLLAFRPVRRLVLSDRAQLRDQLIAARRRLTLLHLRRDPPSLVAEIRQAAADCIDLQTRYQALSDTTVHFSGALTLRLTGDLP